MKKGSIPHPKVRGATMCPTKVSPESTEGANEANDPEKVFTRRRKIGGGAFGVVYEGVSPGGTGYAIKRNLVSKESQLFSSLKEASILNVLRKTKCPFVVELKGVVNAPFRNTLMTPHGKETRDDTGSFVFPLADGTLKTVIDDHETSFFSHQRLMVQILLGLSHIHSAGLIHRDLKPENILFFANIRDNMNNRGVVQLADFGLCKVHTKQGCDTPGVATLFYRPPEVIIEHVDSNYNYDQAVDVWSVGCIFYEMICGRALFCPQSDSDDELLRIICSVIGNDIPQYMQHRIMGNSMKFPHFFQTINLQAPSSIIKEIQECLLPGAMREFQELTGKTILTFVDLLAGMLRWDPKKRFDVQRCLDHKFFDNFKDYVNAHSYPQVKFPDAVIPVDFPEFGRMTMREVLEFEMYQRGQEWRGISSYRVLFHAVNIFYQSVEKKIGGVEIDFYFRVCVYVAMKLFFSVETDSSIDRAGIRNHQRSDVAMRANSYEKHILDCFNCEVYQCTPYEAMDAYFPALNVFETRCLLYMYVSNPNLGGYNSHTIARYFQERVRERLGSYINSQEFNELLIPEEVREMLKK